MADQKKKCIRFGSTFSCWKNADTSRFWVIFENTKNYTQIIGTTRRSILHAPTSSQMPYTAKIKKIRNFTNKIKNPLELRSDSFPRHGIWEGLAACEILLWAVAVMCLRFWDLSKITQTERCVRWQVAGPNFSIHVL